MRQLLIASHNEGKIREFKEALGALGYEAVGIRAVCDMESPAETGKTFEENALIKARAYCKATGLPCLADDSGLEVDALNGAPGVYSARYAGEDASDADNNKKLLAALSKVSHARRGASYVCVLALVFPDGREYLAKGYCDGIITDNGRGENGFGYDPYFFLPAFGRTMAELSMEEKNGISHRGRALRDLLSSYGKELGSE